jgi:hypothetical protein
MNLTAEQIAKERMLFEVWFFGRGISSYATKMYMWDTWLYLVSARGLAPKPPGDTTK